MIHAYSDFDMAFINAGRARYLPYVTGNDHPGLALCSFFDGKFDCIPGCCFDAVFQCVFTYVLSQATHARSHRCNGASSVSPHSRLIEEFGSIRKSLCSTVQLFYKPLFLKQLRA
jgi:hypothetical protein